MNHDQHLPSSSPWGRQLIVLSMWAFAGAAMAQSQGPGQGQGSLTREDNSPPAAAQAAVQAAAAMSHQSQAAVIQGTVDPPGKVIIVPKPVPPTTALPAPLSLGSPVPFAGVRVLRIPTACSPKTNSLDCVQDSTQAGQGASVEGRVRHGVIGEVGTGHATTEGGTGAKREEACTPKAGELTCGVPAKP